MRFIFFSSAIAFSVFAVAQWYINTAYICPAPVTYRIGQVDERFAFSFAQMVEVAASAEVPWEEALGRELFRYDEASDFTINLIYDERQQLASTEEEWRLHLDALQTEHEALIQDIKELGIRYQTEEASYNTAREAYEARLATHNTKVDAYNAEGGAPEEVFAQLTAEAGALEQDLQALLRQERQINDLAREINTLGDIGNEKIATYNEQVLEYNAIFGTLETFTQGDYERERINIYKFANTTELTRVIVHEFGHALGIGHVEGEESVMYYLMTDRDTVLLSSNDIAALASSCGETETWQQKVRSTIRTILTTFK